VKFDIFEELGDYGGKEMLCIGYVGEEAFDIILYMCRTLTKLNHRVWIIDLSETKALLNAINHGMGLDSRNTIVNYRDINYTQRLPSKEELELMKTGVIIMNYGMNYIEDDRLPWKKLYVVINPFPHRLERVNEQMNSIHSKPVGVDILVRDIIVIDDVDRVMEAIQFPHQIEQINYLYWNTNDYECAVNCQRKQIANFSRGSSQMKKYLIRQIHSLLPEYKTGRIKKALKSAERGR
jgi:hypothetical protein